MNVSEPLAAGQHRSRLAHEDRSGWDDDFDVEGDEAPSFDPRVILAAIERNRWIIGAIVCTCLLIGLGVTLLSVPMYRADASVQIDQRAARVLRTEDEDNYSSVADADRYLQTQVDVLKSRALATRVAEDLRLFNSTAFFQAAGLDRILEEPADKKRRAVIDALQSNLTVDLPRNSRVVKVSFASRSPNNSADVANAFTKEFIETSLQRRFDQSAYARSFLSTQLAQAKARLEQSELAAIAYARQERLIDASEAAGPSAQSVAPRSLTTADLVQLNQAYSEAQTTRLQAQEHWQQARATPLLSLPEVLSNSAVQDLSRKRAELEADYQQERQRHKEDYPTVRQAQASIKAISQQINTIGASILMSLRYNYEAAAKQEKALEDRIGELKTETLSEQDRSVRYNILKREADTNRQLYDGLLQRFREVSAASGATNNNISIIDRAEPPFRPYSPRPAINLALAGLAGLALSALFVFGRERFDDAIHQPEDTTRKLGLPLLGVLPRVASADPVTDLDNPRSALAEANQALRTSLELASAVGMPRTLLLTSSRQGEGKSTTAVSLALTLAKAGKRVLLIDADLRKPSIHNYLGIANDTGLSTILAGQTSVAEGTKASSSNGLSVISSGPTPPDAAQLLASDRLPAMLSSAASMYDSVIIDGPPVLGLADAPRLASTAEGVAFIVEADRAHRGGAKSALKRLTAVNAAVVGLILTKYKSKYGGNVGYGYYNYNSEPDKKSLLSIFKND